MIRGRMPRNEEIESLLPTWLGEAEVYAEFFPLRDMTDVEVYFNINRSDWCKITDEGIDVSCEMRADWSLSTVEVEKIGTGPVVKVLVDALRKDLIDLFMTFDAPDWDDPLLHYGKDARFIPRANVREFIQEMPDYLAPQVAEDSSFREEDWYKEWEAARETE